MGLAEPTPIMSVLRGTEQKKDRLSVRHLDLRDAALAALESAEQAIDNLVKVEKGSKQKDSPRYLNVMELRGEVRHITDKLDRVYV